MVSKVCSINKNIRLCSIILTIIVLVIGLYVLISTLSSRKVVEKKEPVYSYKHKAQIDYKVNLNLNDTPLEVKDFVAGNTYPSNLVDSVSVSLIYDFNGERIVEGKGQYDVTAVIEGQVPGEKEGSKTIFSKKKVIKNKTEFIINDKKFQNKEGEISVDIKEIRKEVDRINRAFGGNFDIKYSIVWNVDIEAKTDKGIIKEKLSPVMEIPIQQNIKLFEVKGNLSEEKNGTIDETKKEPVSMNKSKLIVGCVMIVLSAATLIFLVFFTAAATAFNPLEKNLKRIFKVHGDRLVALYDDLYMTNEGILRVISIEDLVRVADETHKPILYKKSLEKGEMYKFYVIDESKVYELELGLYK